MLMKISVFPAAEKDSAAFQNFGEGTPAKYVFLSIRTSVTTSSTEFEHAGHEAEILSFRELLSI
jgi:hypothetical protein